jgi:hypothetical protein
MLYEYQIKQSAMDSIKISGKRQNIRFSWKICLNKMEGIMKKIVYIICLLLAFMSGGTLIFTLFSSSLVYLEKIPGVLQIIKLVINLISSIIPLLVLYRTLVFIKLRSIVIPANFNGVIYFVGWVAMVLAIITLLGYAYALSYGAGVSGVPFAYALVLTGLFSVIPVIYCEAKEFYAIIPENEAE